MTLGLFGLIAIASTRPFQIDEPAVIPLGPSGFQTNPVTLPARVLAFDGDSVVTGDPVEIAAHSFIASWYALGGIGFPPKVRSAAIRAPALAESLARCFGVLPAPPPS